MRKIGLVIPSLRNMFRYLRSTISIESRHVGSDPFANSQITSKPEVIQR
jgi:hypothetical protein